MFRRLPFLSLLLLAAPAAPAAEPTYWQDVRPALRKHCTVCHAAKNLDEFDLSGGIALDSYEAILKGQKKPLFEVGKSGDSRLIRALVTDDTDRRMPLGGKPVPPETVAMLRAWIDGGAKEGIRPDSDPAATTTTTAPPRVRKLDVTLTTAATPPAGVFGTAAPAPLKLTLNAGPLAPVTAVCFSPDGKTLAVGTYGRVILWDARTGKPLRTLTNVLAAVNDVRFSPDGSLMAVAGGQPSAKGDLRLYQTSDWKLLAVLGGHEDVVNSVAFSPDGKRLASASFDRTVRIWDVAGRKAERTLTGHSDFVYAVAFGPDGSWLVSAGKDRSAKLVETATGKSRFTFSDRDQDVIAVAVTPDGTSVVVSGLEPGITWWNARTGEKVRAQAGHSVAVHELCFSRDGKLLASAGGDGTVRLWNGSSGAPLRSLAAGSTQYAVALSPDGKIVAAGGFDGLVRLWDTQTGRPLLTLLALPPRDGEADWLALTPEGYAIAGPKLTAAAKWSMGNAAVPADAVWKALADADSVAQAIQGKELKAVTFGK
jgi:hypothetical protein